MVTTPGHLAHKDMTELVNGMKNMEIVGNLIDIKSSLKDDREHELDELAEAIYQSLQD